MYEKVVESLESPNVKLLYFGLLILFVLLIVWYLKNMSSKAEQLEGNQIYTAGATMRVLGQQFTSTDQGSNDIVYNDEIKDWNNYKQEGLMNPFAKKIKKNEKI